MKKVKSKKRKIIKAAVGSAVVGSAFLSLLTFMPSKAVKAGIVGPGGLDKDTCATLYPYDTRTYSLSISGTFSYEAGSTIEQIKADLLSQAKITYSGNYCSSASGSLKYESRTLDANTINITNDGGLNPDLVGVYKVTISSDHNTSTTVQITITERERDNEVPVFDGYEGSYYSNVDNPTTTDKIKEKITAYDEVDGVVDVYVVEDNFTGHETELGEHTIKFGAKDKSQNEATITITVVVVDVTDPVISGTSSVDSKMSNPESIESIKAKLSVSDNVDQGLAAALNVVEDNFTGHENEIGDYTVKFNVTDSSGNQSTDFTVTVHTKDDVAPVLTATSTSIDATTSSPLTVDYLKGLVSVSDNIDSDLTVVLVEDNYTSNEKKVGEHTVKFKATDKSGNIGYITFTVNVSDEDAPYFYIPDYFIVTEVELSKDQIKDILAKYNNISNYTGYTVNASKYYQNSHKNGDYTVSVAFKTEEGAQAYSAVIRVINQEENYDSTDPADPESATKKKDNIVIRFFKWIWASIKSLFNFKK